MGTTLGSNLIDRRAHLCTGEPLERLIQFLERRQIPLESIARGEREESLLTSVVDFLYPRGLGRRYSFTQAAEIVGLDPDVARRLREASAPIDEMMDEHDVRMLEEAKVALDAGFPEAAPLQLVRVYAMLSGVSRRPKSASFTSTFTKGSAPQAWQVLS